MKVCYVFLLAGLFCCCHALIDSPSFLASLSEDFNSLLAESQEDNEEQSSLEEASNEDLLQQSSSSDATCNATLFKKCNVDFGKELNITVPIRTASDFIKFLRKIIYKEGQEGFKRICKAFRNHKKCLGASFSGCINIENFEKQGVKPKDAYAYVTIIYEFNYECSPAALKVILDNWKCIGNVEKRSKEHIRKCIVDFMKNVKKQPSKVCPLAQKMVMCIDFPFGKACNKSVVSVLCNSVKAGLKVSLPKCNIKCPKAIEEDVATNSEELQALPDVSDQQGDNDDEVQFVRQQSDTSIIGSASALPGPLSKDILQLINDQSDAHCDDPKFQAAIDHFSNLFGFQKLPKNSTEFLTAVKSYMDRQGKHGFKKVCEAGKELYRRLGKDQYNLCMTQQNFQKMGYSKIDAFIYMDVSAQLFYECGDGYEVYFANFDCIIKTGQDKAQDLQKCGTDFQRNSTQDPKHVCDYAQTLLRCVEKPYDDSCGDDVAKAICTTGKIQLNHVLPKCKSVTCSKSSSVGKVSLRGVKIRRNNRRGVYGGQRGDDSNNPDLFFDIFQNNVGA